MNNMSSTLPNLLELSLRRVLALPNASRMGLVLSTRCSSSPTIGSESDLEPSGAVSMAVMRARYDMMNFVASVFPAPDSPEIMMVWSFDLLLILALAELFIKAVYAFSASTNR